MSKRELFDRHPGNPILTSADWPYPVNAVFNPAAAVVGDETLVLARVEDLRGISHLSVARSANGVDGWTVDPAPLLAPEEGIESEEWGFEDARVVWVTELERWAITCTSYGPPGPAVYLALTDDFRTVERHGVIKGAATEPKGVLQDMAAVATCVANHAKTWKLPKRGMAGNTRIKLAYTFAAAPAKK